MEAERIGRLKGVAGEMESGGQSLGSNCRGAFDVPIRGRTLGRGTWDKRKRWSVSGAERRGDIDLETIWED